MSRNIKAPNEGQIYTLVQSGTNKSQKVTPTAIIQGLGTIIKDNKSLEQRAKRKTITRALTLALVDIANDLNDQTFIKKYRNTFYCQNTIVEVDGSLFGNYCKNRFCTICLAIRKAELINKYYPVLSTWENPYLVTLTAKAVEASKLKRRIFDTQRAFKIVLNRLKKRNQRGAKIDLRGIKSLECNFNPVKRTYNPHFHLIVPNQETAQLFRDEWLKLWSIKWANKKAQDIREIDGLGKALIETIKYGSKIIIEPDEKKKINLPTTIYAKGLHNIFKALEGHRVFDRFGFNLNKPEIERTSAQAVVNFRVWKFEPTSTDWTNTQTGEKLTGFTPSFQLEHILNNRIDKDKS